MNATDRHQKTLTFVSLVAAAALQGLVGCSSDSPGTQPDGSSGSGGTTGSGSGGATGSGGASSGTGGASNGDSGTTGSGGVSGSGGGSGGTVVNPPDGGGSGGAAPGDVPTAKGFTCTQVMGVSVTYDWFTGGFEMGAGIDGAHWQGLAPATPLMSFIQDWANPSSPLYNMAKLSPCTSGSTNPDRVILVGVNFSLKSAAEWLAQYDAAVKTIQAKYPGVKEIDLDTLIRGPGNKNCGGADATSEVVVQPFIDDAIAMAVAKYPNLVKAAPKLYVPNCNVFTGAGPHFTAAGVKVVAKVYSDYYVNHQ